MKMKEPKNIDELYKNARFLLLYCQVDVCFKSYGNLNTPHRIYSVHKWGNFVIMETTFSNRYTDSLINALEIPRNASVKNN